MDDGVLTEGQFIIPLGLVLIHGLHCALQADVKELGHTHTILALLHLQREGRRQDVNTQEIRETVLSYLEGGHLIGFYVEPRVPPLIQRPVIWLLTNT